MLVFVVFVAGQGTEHCSDGHIVQTKVQQLYINKHQPAAPQARCSKNTLRGLLPVTSSWIWTRCKPTTPAGLWTVWTLKFSRLFRHVQCNNSFSANLKVSVQIIFFTVFTLVFLFWSFPSLQLIIRTVQQHQHVDTLSVIMKIHNDDKNQHKLQTALEEAEGSDLW